jgi:hypothetical protein
VRRVRGETYRSIAVGCIWKCNRTSDRAIDRVNATERGSIGLEADTEPLMRLNPPGFLLAAAAAVVMSGCAPSAQTPTDANEPLSLPFAVSDYFTPTGAYGDASSPSNVTVSLVCDGRAPDARGDCYNISYIQASAGYGGVFWQFPPSNWGTDEGRRVASGATHVTLYARALGTTPLPVTFGVGGIGVGSTTSEPFHDTVDATIPATLGSEWQAFSIPITKSYDWVLGGFSWEASTQTPIAFEIDSVEWQ